MILVDEHDNVSVAGELRHGHLFTGVHNVVRRVPYASAIVPEIHGHRLGSVGEPISMETPPEGGWRGGSGRIRRYPMGRVVQVDAAMAVQANTIFQFS